MFIERAIQPSKQRRPIFGVGINDAPYVIGYRDAVSGKMLFCPYYKLWVAVLERCFCPKFHLKRPTYAACTLEESWKRFSNFKAWVEVQDWKGKHLDKDLKVQGNKHYGPDTCLFISPALNNLLCVCEVRRGAYPLGVSKTTIGAYVYFQATCSLYGKKYRLGFFQTVEEAAQVYKRTKLNYIAELAANEPDLEIKQALLRIC